MKRERSIGVLVRFASPSAILVALLAGCGGKDSPSIAVDPFALPANAETPAFELEPGTLGSDAGDWATYAKCLEFVSQHRGESEDAADFFLLDFYEDMPEAVAPDFRVPVPWCAEALALLRTGVSGEGDLKQTDFSAVRAQVGSVLRLDAAIWLEACRQVEAQNLGAARDALNMLFQFAADLLSHGDLDLQMHGLYVLGLHPLDGLYACGWWAQEGAAMSPLILAAGREIEEVLLERSDVADRTALAVMRAQLSAIPDIEDTGLLSTFEGELSLVFELWSDAHSGVEGELWHRAETHLADSKFKDSQGIARMVAARIRGLAEMRQTGLARVLARRAVDAALNGDLSAQPTAHGMVATTARVNDLVEAGDDRLQVVVHDTLTKDEVVTLHALPR